MEFLNKVLENIKPTKEYENYVISRVSKIIEKINKSINDGKAVLGGSGAKGTALKTFDADIFVKFNYNKYKDKSSELSDILEKKLKKSFKNLERLHGSRDYFHIVDENLTIEIVPILDIKNASQAKNITDVSPLHAKWVLQHKKHRDEIRLTKQFCKSQGVYGAESHIKGFSGYICEILAIYYGSFVKLIRNSAKWKEKTVIDIERYYKRKDVFMMLNKSKLLSPLIVIDPVQADRNAAAAISQENFEKFILASKDFIKKPSKKFFEIKKFDINEIIRKNKQNKVIVLKAKPVNGKDDVVGCKIIKAVEFFKQHSDRNDFKLIDYGWNWDKDAIFYYIFDKKTLSPNKTVEGPPARMKEHVKDFKKKHKKVIVKKGKVFGTDKRKYRKPEGLFKDLLKNNYLKSKVKKIELI